MRTRPKNNLAAAVQQVAGPAGQGTLGVPCWLVQASRPPTQGFLEGSNRPGLPCGLRGALSGLPLRVGGEGLPGLEAGGGKSVSGSRGGRPRNVDTDAADQVESETMVV